MLVYWRRRHVYTVHGYLAYHLTLSTRLLASNY